MLIVPFVLEVTFSGLYGSRPWANVQHLVWEASTGDRDAGPLDDIALAMDGAFANGIMQAQNNKCSLTNTKVADLDSALGLVANLPGSSTGDLANAAMAPNVAALATKVDGHSRSQRPGRMFLTGVSESQTDSDVPGLLTAGALTAWQTALTDYLNDLSGTAGGSPYFPVVLHKSTAPSGFSPFAQTGLVIQATLATQRRRLRG